jgi:hypothetical protein
MLLLIEIDAKLLGKGVPMRVVSPTLSLARLAALQRGSMGAHNSLASN